MAKYIIRRILSIIPTILIIVFAIFFILDCTPGTPGRVILGVTATEEQVKNIVLFNGVPALDVAAGVKYTIIEGNVVYKG